MNYQTYCVYPNLVELTYGPELAGRNKSLFVSLQKMSLKWDEGAPIEVAKVEKASFEEKSDIKILRVQI